MYTKILNSVFFGATWEKLSFEIIAKNKFLIISAIKQAVDYSNDRTIVEGFKIPANSGESDIWNMFLSTIEKEYTEENLDYDKWFLLHEVCNKVRAWKTYLNDMDPHISQELNELQLLKIKAQKFKKGGEPFKVKANYLVQAVNMIDSFLKAFSENLIQKDQWYFMEDNEIEEVAELRIYLINQLECL